MNKEIQQEIYSIFNTKLSFPNQVEDLLNLSEVPIVMPSPWALVSQSLLGTANVAAKDEIGKIFILDLASCVVYEKNSTKVELTKQQTNFLSILVIAGKLGLPVELIKQWLIESDVIKWKGPEWESQTKFKLGDDRFNLLRNRIDGLKRDINKKLKPLALRICGEKGKGRWYLKAVNSDQEFVIKLSNSVWGKFCDKKETNYTLQGLSKQSKLIWQCLCESYPYYVHAKKLAEILEKEWDNEKTQKQISDAIYKLKLCLKNEPWMIKHSLTGEYALVPRQ